VAGGCLRRLVGHVAPMLIVAKFLRDQGHVTYLLTSDAFSEKVEVVGQATFLPLAGNANYDYRKMNTSRRTLSSNTTQLLIGYWDFVSQFSKLMKLFFRSSVAPRMSLLSDRFRDLRDGYYF
jgi:UDP:flavonoid glycosyltransferase YjiC (YdhE family)